MLVSHLGLMKKTYCQEKIGVKRLKKQFENQKFF